MSESVKVVFVVTKGDTGGAQKYVEQIAAGLDRERFETMVVTGREGEGGIRAEKKMRWLTNKWQPFFLFYQDVMAIWELRRFFKRVRPAVVHLNSSKAGVVGAVAAKLAGVPRVVFTAHGWVFADEKLSYLRRLFYRWLHRIAAYFQNMIITVSEYDRKLAAHHRVAPEKKLVRIWNGINLKQFQLSLLEKEKAREEIKSRISNDQKLEQVDSRPTPSRGQALRGNDKGMDYSQRGNDSSKEIWVGSIGRLVKEKNYQLLVEAIENYKETLRSAGRRTQGIKKMRCFIVGEGYEREAIELKVKSLKLEEDVFIVPPRGEDAKLMRAFDVFVLPSRKEGLPYTLIEAFVARVPAVVSRTGGMTELVEGGRGWVFESGDASGLTGKIIEVLNNCEERERRTEAARKFAEEELTAEKMIAAVSQIYKS